MHERLIRAREFALAAHNTQIYGGIYPYYKHLEDVHDILVRFMFTEEEDLAILTASFLHDTIEDTATSHSDIKKIFGEEIADIVYDMSDELGRSREEKKAKTYSKTRLNHKSVILKVADRIANVTFSSTQNSKHIQMYREEHNDFEKNLRIYRQVDDMWEYLRSITFPIVVS